MLNAVDAAKMILQLPPDQQMVAVEAYRRVYGAQPQSYNPHRPTDRQKVFLDIEDLEAFYGGAAGGGKTDALLMAALKYVHVPGYTALLVMKTFADLSKPGALMDRAHGWLQGTGAEWSEKYKRWTFPTSGESATLDFGYLQTDADKYQYRTAEYQFIGVDELTRFAKPTYTYLFSRLRRLKTSAHVPIRMRSASNPAQPGEPGMQWVEERFIPDDFDPESEAQHEPRVIVKEGMDEQTGGVVRRNFVFARLEDNPHLDADEYDRALAELDPVSRAQLRRGDWKIRHRGDIYWMWNEDYHVISWPEFARVYGVRHIPDHWQLSLSQDQGTSEGHIGATAWFANAPENAHYSDTVFMYRAMTSIEEAPSDVARRMVGYMGSPLPRQPRYYNEESPDVLPDGYGGRAEMSRLKTRLSSHEAKSEKLEYQKYGLDFMTWKAGPNIGIAQVRNRLSVIDRDKPNPFRPELMGRPRFMLVVPDDELKHPKTDRGMARVRAEFAAYHYAKLKSGEATRSDIPDAHFNDFMDAIREAAFSAFPAVLKLTNDEKFEQEHPKLAVKQIERDIESGERSPNAFHAREVALRDWNETHNKPTFVSAVASRRYGGKK
jgi:hypothetical protein